MNREAIVILAWVIVVITLCVAPTAPYWLARREYYRWRWHRQEITAGEFFDALRTAPSWLSRSTVRGWKRAD